MLQAPCYVSEGAPEQSERAFQAGAGAICGLAASERVAAKADTPDGRRISSKHFNRIVRLRVASAELEHARCRDKPRSGIYRCLSCNKEIASNEDDPFPTQNHYPHTTAQSKIRWKLNVSTSSGD